MVRVLGIYGSPRKKGNSGLLLDRALEGARQAGAEVSSLRATRLKIGGCLECGGCDQTGTCVIDDDMQKVYPELAAANRIIVGTPVFFYAAPAQLKALIDRTQAAWSKRMLEKTKEQRKSYDSGQGYLIGVGATKGPKLFDGLEQEARYFFDALDMSYQGGLFFRGLDEKGAVLDRQEFLTQAFELGHKIASES